MCLADDTVTAVLVDPMMGFMCQKMDGKYVNILSWDIIYQQFISQPLIEDICLLTCFGASQCI